MWITTKSIVKEIKKNQEDFAVQLKKIAVEQRENAETLQRQIAALAERIDCLEKLNSEDRERNSSNYAELVRLIEDINKLLNDLQRNIFTEFESCTQRVNDQIISSSQNRCNDISDEIRGICCAIKDMTALSENQDRVVSENIETMSVAMQEIIRGLLSLDEANRLIIAKLLLKDMEI